MEPKTKKEQKNMYETQLKILQLSPLKAGLRIPIAAMKAYGFAPGSLTDVVIEPRKITIKLSKQKESTVAELLKASKDRNTKWTLKTPGEGKWI
jgi:antitoxin component of MazEF toxin-antitoxin module